MLNTKYTRTTITLPEELLYEIKKKALSERKTIKDVIQEHLSRSLGYHDQDQRLKLHRLAETVVGSIDLSKYPQWKTKKELNKWLRKLREAHCQ